MSVLAWTQVLEMAPHGIQIERKDRLCGGQWCVTVERRIGVRPNDKDIFVKDVNLIAAISKAYEIFTASLEDRPLESRSPGDSALPA